MKVIIKEREHEFETDSVGWKFSAGDPFKFPVRIGKYNCFIKKFEKKKTADISGWQLLLHLKGKFEPNLPRLYDIVSTTEDNQPVYYLFYEYLEGQTLDQRLAQQEPVDLPQLTADLFKALEAVHRQEHWYADFTEKNIFYQESDNRFLLIDLDSVQPVSEVPQHDMFGDKAYWALVLRFYKEVVGYQQLKLAELPGPVLNCLQVIFLILRLKIYEQDQKQTYKSSNIYEKLVASLEATDAIFPEVFARAYQDSRHSCYLGWTAEIQEIILQKIILGGAKLPEGDQKSEDEHPVIKHFGTSATEVEAGNSFTLSWEVEKATKVKVYRNGAFYKEVLDGNKSIKIKEAFDGRPREIKYSLWAINNLLQVESEVVSVRITDAISTSPPPEPVIVSFEADKYKLKNGDTLRLRWDVEYAKNLELYRNGTPYIKGLVGKSNIEINEPYDGKTKVIIYTLRCSDEGYIVESSPLSIEITAGVEAAKIIFFESNTYNVKKRGTVRLSWQVENVSFLKLKRNGIVLKDLKIENNLIEIIENFSEKGNEVKYTLLAANDYNQIESEPLTIRRNKDKLTIILILLVLSVAIIQIMFIVYDFFRTENNGVNIFSKNQPVAVNLITKSAFSEGKSVVITGNNFPTDSNNLQVLFNTIQGEIIGFSKDTLNVIVPQLGRQFSNGKVQVAVVVEGNKIKAWDTLFVREISIYTSVASEGQPLNVIGNFFPADANKIRVLFDDVESRINNYSGDTLKVTVPVLDATSTNPSVNVGVVINGDTTYARQNLLIRKIKLARTSILEGGTLVISGTNLPIKRNQMQILFNQVKGRITQNSENSLKVIVPKIGTQSLLSEVQVAVVIDSDTIKAPGKLIVRKRKEPPLPPRDNRQPIKEGPREIININNLVNVINKGFKRRTLGGIQDLVILVKNDSRYDLDEVIVEISYQKNNGEVLEKKNLAFNNVSAHESLTLEGPNFNRGTNVSLKIIAISSKQLDNDLH